MAQTFPTSAQVIYDTLAADSTFTDLLGTYEFRAGQTTTAISVISAGEDLPSLRNVQGVECVILDAGNTKAYEYLTGDAPRLQVDWSVFLVCWEPATGADLQAATERALSRFLGAYSVQTVATSDGLGSLVQNKLMIRSDRPVVAAA